MITTDILDQAKLSSRHEQGFTKYYNLISYSPAVKDRQSPLTPIFVA